ncbi:hypothetical protein HanIR_Chr15g0731261 [Helianthus annuus]|nr:hypothetical protein HanIR_Chr15g0731261 [Helianthus annuus]
MKPCRKTFDFLTPYPLNQRKNNKKITFLERHRYRATLTCYVLKMQIKSIDRYSRFDFLLCTYIQNIHLCY